MSHKFVVISGCSSGGKSVLLAALKARGFAVVEEPGRRVVKRELAAGGSALPWMDMAAFAEKVLTFAWEDWRAAKAGPVFFDRGLIDAAVALEHVTGRWPEGDFAKLYAQRVFLAPPWPDIFAADAERRHSFAEAEAEYYRLAAAYARLGYEIAVLPKASVEERLAFVLKAA